jgi:hypothetical protein
MRMIGLILGDLVSRLLVVLWAGCTLRNEEE